MLPIKNLNQEMLKRSQLNQNIEPKIVKDSELKPVGVIDNPYPDMLAKVQAGELDPQEVFSKKSDNQKAAEDAKKFVATLSPSNGTRKAIEKLAEALEKAA